MRPWLTVLKKRRLEQDWVFLQLQLRRRCVCLCVYMEGSCLVGCESEYKSAGCCLLKRIPVFSLPFGRCCVENISCSCFVANNCDYSSIRGHLNPPLHGCMHMCVFAGLVDDCTDSQCGFIMYYIICIVYSNTMATVTNVFSLIFILLITC